MSNLFRWGLVLVIGGFFLAAAWSKLADPVAFFQAIERYRLIGGQLAWVTALWVPWLELVGAIALFLPRWRGAGLLLLGLMLGAFEALLLSAYLRGLDIDCGCLGTIGSTSLSLAMIRNLGLLAGLCVLAKFKRKEG